MPMSATSRFDSPEASIAYMKAVAVARSGFSSWLDLEPIKVWEGESELLLVMRPEMTQHHGYAHGAIVGLMADNACAWAGASVVGDVVTGGYARRAPLSRRASVRWWCAPMSGRKVTARLRFTSQWHKRPSCRPGSCPNARLLGRKTDP
jgi:acyl-coenzyme A thioesterase PaaI-like protein